MCKTVLGLNIFWKSRTDANCRTRSKKMKVLLLIAFVGAAVLNADPVVSPDKEKNAESESKPDPTPSPAPVEDRVAQLEEAIKGLSRQVMLQQFFVEEKVRSDGNSGLKMTRLNKDGTRNYFEPSIIDKRFLAIHDHANYDRTVGLGELWVVMNGVEFRTRHNDYKLRMPSKTNSDYNSVEDIPFPDVPQSVLGKATIEEQSLEMREYFKAFLQQDDTIRDYKPYFKPNLCYMEGAWTLSSEAIDEPFQSDRHFVDAASWYELMDKIRFTSYTGSKSLLENFAYLPTTIYNVTEDGIPQYAQWNYRILCHPLKDDLPTSVFHRDDDLVFRLPHGTAWDKMHNDRAERFRIDYQNTDHYSKAKSLLDDLMMQIPGKDNYPADLADHSMNMTMLDARYIDVKPLNSGYYHRYFRTGEKGAMGTRSVHRGFSDAFMFVAQTTQKKIAPTSLKSCKGKKCHYWTTRYTYAVPLEIVYMTPLLRWNPHDLPLYKGKSPVREHKERTGGRDKETAYNGTFTQSFYYRTPKEFYGKKPQVQQDAADSARGSVGVLDKQGEVRMVAASGVHIVTPYIEGVGEVRLRYPIMPVHGEGSAVWKELNALKEMTMKMDRYAPLYEEPPAAANKDGPGYGTINHYQMSYSNSFPPGQHRHDLYISSEQLKYLKDSTGNEITVTTSQDMEHSHELILKYTDDGRVKIHKRNTQSGNSGDDDDDDDDDDDQSIGGHSLELF